MNTPLEKWERFLDPDVIRPSLFLATMFITAFEVLKNTAIERIRSFYIDGLDESGPVVSDEYKKEVVSRNKNILYASLEWLQESGVINDKDMETFEELKATRNQLAHQLFETVTGQVESKHEEQFAVLIGLLRKIEVWWVVNFEIPINPDYEGQEIDEEGIVLGAILSLQLFIEVASGNTEFLEQWRKLYKQGKADA
jgi:hypothetical protein